MTRLDQGRDLPIAPSNAEGAFTVRVLADEDYILRAWVGDRSTELRRLRAAAGDTVEMELVIPGAFGVRGALRDVQGRPVQGDIHVWAQDTPAGFEGEWSAKCDPEGRFEVLLSRAGVFEVLGGTEGRTPAKQRVELYTSSPVANIDLCTQPFGLIAGLVLDHREQPLRGVTIELSDDAPPSRIQELCSSLHGPLPSVTSDERGEFQVMAPIGHRYQLGVRLIDGTHGLCAKGPTVAAPATQVRMTVTTADLQGFEVLGKVIDGVGASAELTGRVSIITHLPSGRVEQDDGTAFTGGGFRVGPLSPGTRITLEVVADGRAPLWIGPFDTSTRQERVVVHAQPFGRVRVRVLRADGNPAAQALASLLSPGNQPFGRSQTQSCDADGWVEFPQATPGSGVVQAQATNSGVLGATTDIVVRPGQTTEVVLTLPR